MSPEAATPFLPPELERAVKIAHRSQTFAVKLPDGRDLHVRREAVAQRPDGTRDLQALANGDGALVWYARCGSGETWNTDLARALHRVVCSPVEEDDADGHWEQIKLLFTAGMALVEVAVPAGQQAVADD